MSVGFGFSVGDFVAALKLVGIVVDALRESSHASSSFRSLINELYALESVLLRVKRLDLDDCHSVEKLALRQAACQCQRTIDEFWNKIQKYQPHLQQSGTESRIMDGWAKVKWAVCKKNDLETFRAQIRGHISSIEILLLTVQMEVSTMDTHKHGSHIKSLGGRLQDLSCQAMGKLSTIADNVGQCVQQGKALLESSAQIVQTNLRVFQIVHDIQLLIFNIPGQVQRQQPVYLVDAFNRESPFHLEFVRSAEALLAVLKININESGCDTDMIDRGEFVIEESGTQNLINLKQPWDGCFYPGQRVAMSVVFKQRRTPQSSCPRCGKDHTESTGKEIACIACGTIFRRIEELVEESRGTSVTSHSGDQLYPEDLPEGLYKGPPKPSKRRKKGNDDALPNVQKFRRIQLLLDGSEGKGRRRDGEDAEDNEVDKKFRCLHEGCEKTFEHTEDLYRHQLNHNPKQIYHCDYPDCRRSFYRQDLCARHKERHTDFSRRNLNPAVKGSRSSSVNSNSDMPTPVSLSGPRSPLSSPVRGHRVFIGSSGEEFTAENPRPSISS